ncbi:hypothetical protein [Blastococcus capsensis]|uniref:hypothetical protein n=1 Tax=Blastococcus capsensis TaxID=1564163 RepID=UPI002541BA9D|nr:hypothetical protein [Blastococcus capsensis]MDK3256698.1 hypothetical protein [Blastococcus capsensis]
MKVMFDRPYDDLVATRQRLTGLKDHYGSKARQAGGIASGTLLDRLRQAIAET